MKKIISMFALISLSITGCGSSEKQLLVQQYFDAMQSNDVSTLRAILKNPKNADMFSADSGFSMSSKNIEVLDEVPQGVNVMYTRFCYADIIVPTIVIKTDAGYKIDLMATMKNEFKAMKNSKTLEKYCYAFDDMPLNGKLNGQAWSFIKSHNREIYWGTYTSTNISLYGEDCDVEFSGKCTLPYLIISNLNLSSDGGNLNTKENLTIHMPPSDNLIVSQGSYRVSKLENNTTKLELSFKVDDDNFINGQLLLIQK